MSDHRGFAGAQAPERWPPTRGRPRPEELNRSLDTLPGVGPSQRGKLAKLGLRTVRDLLEHRPRDYQQAVGETPISNLFGEEEAAADEPAGLDSGEMVATLDDQIHALRRMGTISRM